LFQVVIQGVALGFGQDIIQELPPACRIWAGSQPIHHSLRVDEYHFFGVRRLVTAFFLSRSRNRAPKQQ
jgi:hypothetical protein